MMPQIEASINRGKPDTANSAEWRVILVLDRSGNAIPPVLRKHEHPPAGAVDHDAATPCRGAGLARPAHRDCSFSTRHRQPDGNLAPECSNQPSCRVTSPRL